MTIDTSFEHERAKERVIQFTNLGRVHKLVEERITNSPDGGVEINYVNQGCHLARVDMAKDGKVYLIMWNRGNILPPIGEELAFSDKMMESLIHRIKHFLEYGSDL